MMRAVFSALRSFSVAATATSVIALAMPALAADAVVEDYPDVAAYRDFCLAADYYERYPTFCSGFFDDDPCAEDYACDEHSYPMTYDSYRGYYYQAPFGDPYRGTARCSTYSYPEVCFLATRD